MATIDFVSHSINFWYMMKLHGYGVSVRAWRGRFGGIRIWFFPEITDSGIPSERLLQ